MNRRMPLAELLPDVAGIPADLVITGLVQDSRALKPGDAFVAIGGFGTHGLKFVEQARAAGAVAILFEPPDSEDIPAPADAIAVPRLRARLGELADRFHGRVSAGMRVVGVTGTNGKTSTVQLIGEAWRLQGVTGATIGTLGAGLAGQVVPTGFTTPLVLQLHDLIDALHGQGADALAMEVSSHALDQGRVDGVHFDVAVFTNLSRDHLDYHGDMAGYGAAKARLFAWPGLQAAVINLDDAHGRALHAALPEGVRAIGVSSRGAAGAVLVAESLRFDNGGIGFELVAGDERHPVTSPLLGRFNVDNLLAVAGALHALGGTAGDIAALLSQLQPVHGRMNRLGGDTDSRGRRRPLVVVDYAHTPDALEQALVSLRAHAAAQLICVFGCGGERDRGKRPQMASIAQTHADVVIVTDDNPRGEDGDAIVAEIVAGFIDASEVTVERDRGAAIRRAIGIAGPDDIVLVAGKGHEPYQEINGVRHPFDDTGVARAALEARP
ncbi:UDP-N-acetylmuramoylalanyl-D-glutamate--2,6-diaminopimelate ligase [Lysobacter arseniciresistens ZS79]|uniref:UDP-N-acetylmuramoyl-L-alanyl-D-glutamate--2,6-diaminopimelate ligase n=1 Tax=Lysobacter arseniciresistens ZS79 TaxID=913325 RepID=A0A0A0F034_9GAMM|nr:UDP-N-acetylmuramoyl-L-alanyl-D-glutamate--2,6-diaminopimelate ligase [Lysobacter arseniciresistens]KGM56546.1 UDP-N-acetylmuramoylalanyl-D-glutamate--2,6-diaminopimelate ligase [Lysobacter arseniciresistens ZS79]